MLCPRQQCCIVRTLLHGRIHPSMCCTRLSGSQQRSRLPYKPCVIAMHSCNDLLGTNSSQALSCSCVCWEKPSKVSLWLSICLQGSGTQVTREMETQVLITALALPYGGKILFAATELGDVRCYKYPLTGQHQGVV